MRAEPFTDDELAAERARVESPYYCGLQQEMLRYFATIDDLQGAIKDLDQMVDNANDAAGKAEAQVDRVRKLAESVPWSTEGNGFHAGVAVFAKEILGVLAGWPDTTGEGSVS